MQQSEAASSTNLGHNAEGELGALGAPFAGLAEAPKERRQVTLVFESCLSPPTGPGVLTKTTKTSTKDTKLAAPTIGLCLKPPPGMASPPPPFPQHFPQNEAFLVF
jgi:hypothetical protein